MMAVTPKSRFWLTAAGGFAVGVVNGLLGTGGGLVAVPLLKKAGLLSQKAAHASSIAVILPLSALSAALYLFRGSVAVGDALIYMPAGLAGAFLGSLILPKIPESLLRRIFGAFMVWAGARLLFR